MNRYAPVIIPTLNRFDHFTRCIESLQKCSGASCTEVYISVDAPFKKSHMEGYDKIVQYIENGIVGFHAINVIIQKENLGPYGNYRFLIETAYKNYDRFIFSEDDNEFSPNFLEFINKGLDIFEEEAEVLAICSNVAVDTTYDTKSIVKSMNFSAYGYGTWKAKEIEYSRAINRNYFDTIAKNPKKLFKLYQFDVSTFFSFSSALLMKQECFLYNKTEIACVDMTLKVYLCMEEKYVICPTIATSRNNGYDGSGVNCKKTITVTSSDFIDSEQHFNYENADNIMTNRLPNHKSLNLLVRVIYEAVKIIYYNRFREHLIKKKVMDY